MTDVERWENEGGETDDNGVKVGQVYAYNSVVYEDEQDAPYYTVCGRF